MNYFYLYYFTVGVKMCRAIIVTKEIHNVKNCGLEKYLLIEHVILKGKR